MHHPPPGREASSQAGLGSAELVLLQQRRQGEDLASALQRLKHICACCHRTFKPGFIERNVCGSCRDHLECAYCRQPFEPTKDSFALFCPTCWPYLSGLAGSLREVEPSEARRELRRQAQRALSPHFPCAHRLDGPFQ